MVKEFKKLRGNRIYLELPMKEGSKVIVDENTKKALIEKFIKDMTRAKVYAIGDLITDIEVGDEILVDPVALQRAPTIVLSEDRSVVLVSSHDVAHIW